MKHTEFKNVKIRKEQICAGCDKPLQKGSLVAFINTRAPTYDKDDKQNGIMYVTAYFHLNDCILNSDVF